MILNKYSISYAGKIAGCFLALTLISALVFAQQKQYVDYQIHHAHVITMREKNVLKNHTVIVDKGKIIDIFPDELQESEGRRYFAEEIIDANNSYLMPGLADMHAHIRMDPSHAFKLFLANGVTTVRNMGLADGGLNHVAVRTQVEAGHLLGPRYLITGHQLNDRNIRSSKDIEHQIRDHLEKRYDFMKIHGELNDSLFDELIQKSQAKGIRISGHLQRERPLTDSLSMDSIEHVEELLYAFDYLPNDKKSGAFHENYYAHLALLQSKEYRQQIITDFKRSGAYLSPTLTIYHALKTWVDDERFKSLSKKPELAFLPSNIKNKYLTNETNPYRRSGFWLNTEDLLTAEKVLKQLIRELQQAKVPMILGVDAFGTVVPGVSVHEELRLLVESGMSPYHALKTSTLNVAEFLNEAHEFGSIEAGKTANLILLKENPLVDINNTRSVWGVLHNGKWQRSNDLLEDLKNRPKFKDKP